MLDERFTMTKSLIMFMSIFMFYGCFYREDLKSKIIGEWIIVSACNCGNLFNHKDKCEIFKINLNNTKITYKFTENDLIITDSYLNKEINVLGKYKIVGDVISLSWENKSLTGKAYHENKDLRLEFNDNNVLWIRKK